MPDFRNPAHLPNLRADRQPPRPSWLPRQKVGVTPQMIGRYPDFDVLSVVDTWDHATKAVVLARLDPPGPLRFFAPEEEPTLRAFCDLVLAQDVEPRVPVPESIDEKLRTGRLDGFQYADMPDDRDTWQITLRGLDYTARTSYGADSFATAAPVDAEAIIDNFASGDLSGGPWDELNVSRAWSVCMRAILSGSPTPGRGTRSGSAGLPTPAVSCAAAPSAPPSPLRPMVRPVKIPATQ